MRRRPKGFRGLGGPLAALRFRLEHPVARADFAARMGESATRGSGSWPAAWRAPSRRFASGKASRPEGPLATEAVRRAERPAGEPFGLMRAEAGPIGGGRERRT
jgi:hypothetical protein